MTERNALLAIHLGALLFGLSGIFGKLAATTPNMIAGGRALFAVLALSLAAALWRSRNAVSPSLRQMALLALGGLLLGLRHWRVFQFDQLLQLSHVSFEIGQTAVGVLERAFLGNHLFFKGTDLAVAFRSRLRHPDLVG